MGRKPLEGIKVVDLSKWAAAPTAARIFADWGATVYRIEDLNGCPNRYTGILYGYPKNGTGDCLWFDELNANKQLLSFNVMSPEGKEILMKLLEDADVFSTHLTMPSLKKHGLDFETLHKKFPKLICARVTGFGEKGPWKDVAGYDSTAFWGRTGLQDAMRFKGQPILSYELCMGDIITGETLASGILAALVSRSITGEGTYVSTSLYGAGLFVAANMVMHDKYATKYPMEKADDPLPQSTNYDAAEGTAVALNAGNWDRNSKIILTCLGLDELVGDERYCTSDGLMKSGKRGELVTIIAKQMLTKTADEWKEIFDNCGDKGIICDKILSFDDAINSEQARANGMIRYLEYDDGFKGLTAIPHPARFYGCDVTEAHPTKGLGSANDEVFAELGYSEHEIAELREKGIIK